MLFNIYDFSRKKFMSIYADYCFIWRELIEDPPKPPYDDWDIYGAAIILDFLLILFEKIPIDDEPPFLLIDEIVGILIFLVSF